MPSAKSKRRKRVPIPTWQIISSTFLSVIIFLFVQAGFAFSPIRDYAVKTDASTWTGWTLVIWVTLFAAVGVSVLTATRFSGTKSTEQRRRSYYAIIWAFLLVFIGLIFISWAFTIYEFPIAYADASGWNKLFLVLSGRYVVYFSLFALPSPVILWFIVIVIYNLLYWVMRMYFGLSWKS